MSHNNIGLTNALLVLVHEFQPTGGNRVSPGPFLMSEEHKDLVREKYEIGRNVDDHITLFRKQNKKGLGNAEIRSHVVPGPWTPPSSLAFVLGGLNQKLRIWLATAPSALVLLNDFLRPSILARELSLVIECGWIARTPHAHERYEQSSQQPVTVFTPPTSPRMSVATIQRLMNVQHDNLPLKEIAARSIPQEDSSYSDPDFVGSGWFINGVEAAAGSEEEYEARGIAYDYDHLRCPHYLYDHNEYGEYDSDCYADY